MLQIYWVNNPEPLSESLYSEALKNGEVGYRDLEHIFDDKLGIVSYTGHFRNLALRLRLIDEVIDDQYYILSDQTAGAIRHTDSGEQLFDILTRLPHFARWVQLFDRNDYENIAHKEVVPAGARGSEMRQGRVDQFESWAEKITELAGDTTFDELQAEYERRSAYIWEEYISLDNIESDLNPVVLLILLGGAANGGASCKTNRLVDILPCNREEFDMIVDEVFTPVGVPLHRSPTCTGLELTTELQVDNRSALWDHLSDLFDGEVDISSLEDLTNHLQYETNILDFVDTPQDTPLRFTVVDGISEKILQDENQQFTTDFEAIQPVKDAAFVSLPPNASGLTTQELFGKIEQVLESVLSDKNFPDQLSRFEYHVREQLCHLGSIPLIKAPNFDSLTTSGERYLRWGMIARRSLIFDHLLVSNLPVRTIIAAADVNAFRIEQACESWIIRADDDVRVQTVVEDLSDQDELTMIGVDHTDPIAQIVSYLCTADILKGQGAINQLQVSSSIHEHLKQNPRGSRQVLEQAKDRVQATVGDLL